MKRLFFFFLITTCLYGQRQRTDTDRLAYLGRNAFLCGDYEEAYRHFQSVKKEDPDNSIAEFYLPKIEHLLSQRIEKERTATRSELLKGVDDAWQLPTGELMEDTGSKRNRRFSKIYRKLKSIEIDKISFAAIPLSRVVESLSTLSEELDSGGSGLNIVYMGEDKNPNVTITLKNLSLGRVLELIAKSVGFQVDLERDAVILRPGESENTHLETEFFPISRATIIRLLGLREEGKDLSLEEEETLLKRFFSRAGIPFDIAGVSLAFEGTQLIVTQTPRNLERLGNILQRYRETRQVEIEAKFLEVQQGVLDEMGFRWNFGNQTNNQTRIATGTQITSSSGTLTSSDYDNLRTLSEAFSASNSSTGDGKIIQTGSDTVTITNTAPTLPNAINLATKSVSLGNILGVISHYEVSMLLRALEQKTGSDLMSAPKVTVLSGRKAEILVAQEFRYPEKYGDIRSEVGTGYVGSGGTGGAAGVTITAGTPLSFAKRNIGVEMKVTPTVEESNTINLLLEPCVTEFEGFVEYGGNSIAVSGSTTVTVPSGFYQPIFSTRRIKTEVSLTNGATVVMGGLTREEVKEVHDKVPFFGDIPLFGRLFRSKSKSSQKRNLLIFVTANTMQTFPQYLRETK